ncbi:hypothetical protein AVEN_270844-1 [Araneus ventricosus]|uniref:Uncharacterized protein n=1 Tax=Araneus ventricosus TaxID=182803 RepID=A0A4Y2K545_ARAVE|nr:hypothetical protein AVEN_224063-1 [Araneus ventricosus]GBM97829.1 hypothetical protein AVEN_228534-1 [Araneus ventricosus]GBM97833.1 hypothetical protein AVEN_243167-1 [Araneus ventricosus]GBM97848.1 hypothetical protein AVEN_270844-1 [Araneus ventricosus]
MGSSVELLPPKHPGQLKNDHCNSSDTEFGVLTAQPLPKEVHIVIGVGELSPLHFCTYDQKREPIHLSGGFLSTYSWYPLVGDLMGSAEFSG